MSLNLHQKCKERLTEVIAEQLPNISVNNQMFLDRKSTIVLLLAESVLPESGEIKEKLGEYISETPVFDFIYESLSKELYENQNYNTDTPKQKLNQIEGYEDVASSAARLIESFDSLPWKYTLTIKFEEELSKIIGKLIGDYAISETLKIVKPSEEFEKKFPLQCGIKARDRSLSGGLGLLPTLRPDKWDSDSAYLQLQLDGYVGQYGETRTVERAISDLKIFCGLGIALRLFKVNYKYRATAMKSKFCIHQLENGSWIIERIHELDGDVSDAFNDLVLHDLEGKIDTDAKKSVWSKACLESISKVFSNPTKSEKIMLAGQWLFDSYSGKNELLSFIQTTVVLEILLGEKDLPDLMGLGELLRNRCAYLIGKSQQQRDEILEDFKKIYNVRSKIVHRGKSRLTLDESTLFRTLQWMCRRVIQKEVDLLSEDLKKSA